jgi:predicted TIM-barrel fold metal-dependent hydrolase
VRVITLEEHFWTGALRDANREKIAYGNAERLLGL